MGPTPSVPAPDLAYLLALIGVAVYGACITSMVWRWHVVPLGAKPLPWGSALALTTLVVVIFQEAPKPGATITPMGWGAIEYHLTSLTIVLVASWFLSSRQP